MICAVSARLTGGKGSFADSGEKKKTRRLRDVGVFLVFLYAALPVPPVYAGSPLSEFFFFPPYAGELWRSGHFLQAVWVFLVRGEKVRTAVFVYVFGYFYLDEVFRGLLWFARERREVGKESRSSEGAPQTVAAFVYDVAKSVVWFLGYSVLLLFVVRLWRAEVEPALALSFCGGGPRKKLEGDFGRAAQAPGEFLWKRWTMCPPPSAMGELHQFFPETRSPSGQTFLAQQLRFIMPFAVDFGCLVLFFFLLFFLLGKLYPVHHKLGMDFVVVSSDSSICGSQQRYLLSKK